jgi:hypothetical protein
MTSEQRERLLGMILLGTSTRTACDALHVLYCNLLDSLDSDEAFRYGYLSAMAQRDRVSRALGEHSE